MEGPSGDCPVDGPAPDAGKMRHADRQAGEPVTHVSQAYPDRVEVRGRDLSERSHGSPDLHEYFILLTGREPTEDERYFLDLLLVAIAEHG